MDHLEKTLESITPNYHYCTNKQTLETKRVILALHRLPGIGPVKLAQILNQYEIIKQSHFFDSADNCRLTKQKADWAAVDKDLTWAEAENCHILLQDDATFPSILKEIPASPQVLYVRGKLDYLCQRQPTLAIVGSRNASQSGLESAEEFAQYFSNLGFTIVSGLAEGIDGRAHRGALLGCGGTLAVLGNGIDRIYPAQHYQLAHDIALNGALISEFPLGTPPINTNFPRRNRIISGLSIGVIVIEAALKSGSLITAQCALEQGREVFAMPGSIHNTLAKGCHSLIRQGAKLVESAEHVLEELGAWQNLFLGRPMEKHFSKSINQISKIVTQKSLRRAVNQELELPLLDIAHQTLLNQVDYAMTSVDVLIARSQLTASKVSSMLLELEIQGYVKSVQGGYMRL